MIDSKVWTYRSQDGETLAVVSRADVPPIGYPVAVFGDRFALTRHYVVSAVDEPNRILTLSPA